MDSPKNAKHDAQNHQAIRFLLNDHKTIKGLFRQIETVDLRAPEMKPGVAEELFMEVEVHSAIEEEFLYPVVLENGDENLRGQVLQSLDDHRSLRDQIRDLRKLPIASPEFDNGIDELIEAFELHAEEEERDLFPRVEREFADRLAGVAGRMQDRRQDLVSHPRYKRAQPEFAQDPHGGEQKRKHGKPAA